MMPVSRIVAISAIWLACAAHRETGAAGTIDTAVDPIDQLVEKLSASPLWQNGRYPDLDLPKTASTDEIVARVFEVTGLDQGYAKVQRILETRLVQIRGDSLGNYTAVLVDTDLGRKIVLLQYGSTGWWSRVFPIRSSA